MKFLLLLSLLFAVGCYQIHSDDDLRAVPTTNNPNALPIKGGGSPTKAGF